MRPENSQIYVQLFATTAFWGEISHGTAAREGKLHENGKTGSVDCDSSPIIHYTGTNIESHDRYDHPYGNHRQNLI